jgi:hypothetical protein
MAWIDMGRIDSALPPKLPAQADLFISTVKRAKLLLSQRTVEAEMPENSLSACINRRLSEKAKKGFLQ